MTLYRAMQDGEEYEAYRRRAEMNSDGVDGGGWLGQIMEGNCLLSN